MTRGFSFLHLADSHIGVDLPARPRTDRPRRGDEIIAGYRQGLAPALRGEVDLVIHAGDLFDRPRPNQAALAAAVSPLFEIACRGVPVVVVPGNHEGCILPDSLLFSHPNLHVVAQPVTLVFRLGDTRVAVAAVPCIRKQAAGTFGEALRATNWPAARADVNILAVHQAFESARCGPAGYRFRSGADVVNRDAVPAEFDYVAAGHIHRHQVLESPHEDGPPIVYAGSTERVTFAERGEPKGVVVGRVDAAGLSSRFVPHRVRPMVVAAMDVSARSRAEICDEARRMVMELPLGAYALFRLTGAAPASTLRGLDLAGVLRALRPDVLLKLAMRQVRVVPESVRSDTARGRVGAHASGRVFEVLGATRGRVFVFAIEQRRDMPATFGTYAFFDVGGRLLYVGKAKNVRTRVAAHLRGSAAGGFYEGWPGRIARVAVRIAGCELEALLVEAEMIRRHRPPFNRQLRSWQRYCYLCARADGFGTLEVCDALPRGRVCFGPYRSRKWAERVAVAAATWWQTAHCPVAEPSRIRGLFADQGVGRLCARYDERMCAGPCAGRIAADAYADRLRQRDALLAGRDDRVLMRAEAMAERTGEGRDDSVLATLRDAFEQGRRLGQAAALLGCRLVMPPCCGSRTVIRLSRSGLRLGMVAPAAFGAGMIFLPPAGGGMPGALPKDVMDGLCTAARELERRGVRIGDYASQSAASSSAAMPRCCRSIMVR